MNNAKRISRLIQEIDNRHEIVGIAPDNATAISFFATQPSLDLILADIQLGDGLSFESLKSAPNAVPVIFTTAYDHYAVQAFQYNGIDYLLKPIDIARLREALHKVHPQKQSAFTTEDLSQLLAIVKNNTIRYRERFLISQGGDEYLMIPVATLSLIGIRDGLVCIFTQNGHNYPINMTLDELEKQLNPTSFMRVNRQYIIHASDVCKLSTHFFGKLRVHMQSFPDEEIIVSKDKASSVKKWLGS